MAPSHAPATTTAKAITEIASALNSSLPSAPVRLHRTNRLSTRHGGSLVKYHAARRVSSVPRYRRLQRALLLARPLCGRGRPCSVRACDASILTDVSKRKDSANEFATQ